MGHIEIESRILLSTVQRDEILQYMQSIGTIKEVSRVMVDFSGEDRKKTVTLRSNNGRLELVAKTGELHAVQRQEATITLAPGTKLATTLSYMAIMGYENAMVSRRKMYVVKTDTLEYSLRDVLSYKDGSRVSTLLEIEALDGSESTTAQDAINNALTFHNLTPLTKDEWSEWVGETYEHVDGSFHFSDEAARQLEADIDNL